MLKSLLSVKYRGRKRRARYRKQKTSEHRRSVEVESISRCCLSRRHCCHGKHYKAISPHRHIKFFLAIFNYQIKLIKDKKIYERKLAVKELKEGMAQKSY